jgi:hypothetical protein
MGQFASVYIGGFIRQFSMALPETGTAIAEKAAKAGFSSFIH